MPIDRRFLDWKQPALASAVKVLTAERGAAGTLDLSDLIIVTPGAAAGRRLLELLVDEALQQHRPLTPPRIVTQGQLPELLYDEKRPFACTLDQQLAWIHALRETDRERITHLLPQPPELDDLFAWGQIAELLAQLHKELSGEQLEIKHVLASASELPTFTEHERWRVLQEIHDRYLKTLDNLEVWDQQTARLVAIEKNECRCEQTIVLVGVSDLTRVLRAMLDQLTRPTLALVYAPAEYADRFDAYGCLHVAGWLDARIPLQREQIVVTDDPGAQADEMLRWLGELGDRFTTAEVTIGALDEGLVPSLQQRLAEGGLKGRFAGGTSLRLSEVWRLLEALAEYVDSRSSDALAALVRHPAIERWLRRAHPKASTPALDPLSAIDQLRTDLLPTRITKGLAKVLAEDAPARGVLRAIETLVLPLSGAPQAPREWATPIEELLLTIYGGRRLNRNDPQQRAIYAACEVIHDRLVELGEVKESLAPAINGAEALRWMQELTAGQSIPAPAEPEAIEILGWLELPLDDAPAVALVGFNDGFVPKSRNGDAFLPNSLRRRLCLEDNDYRYARDAYVLSWLLAARRELRVIVGRRTSTGDPLLPSRLLFATSDDELVARTKWCFGERPEPVPLRLTGRLAFATQPQFFAPVPKQLDEPVTSMRVTEFRDYLACPYRYYLKQRLKLESYDDATQELDELQFGNLLHDTLSQFGESDVKHSADPAIIGDFLLGTLDDLARRKFSHERWPAVDVQLQLARQRLQGFARWQADWRAQGWQMAHVEISADPEKSRIVVDDEPLYLRGRIDRIDYHPQTKAWFILDYKTGARDKSPQDVHQQKGDWVDLQLPLYRHLARHLEAIERVSLGYIVLPASVQKIGLLSAPWQDEELRDADRVAEQVVRNIRAQLFWPPNPDYPSDYDDFAAIVGTDRYAAAARRVDEEESS